jgi:class 3 adenylate cyclase
MTCSRYAAHAERQDSPRPAGRSPEAPAGDSRRSWQAFLGARPRDLVEKKTDADDPDPAAAIRLGLRITHELMRGYGAPAVRVGLHHGPAIERDGDYFGAAVNLAARVSGEASGGEVLLTASTAARAAELDGVLYEARGRRGLRNVREPVELFAAVRAGESHRERSSRVRRSGASFDRLLLRIRPARHAASLASSTATDSRPASIR